MIVCCCLYLYFVFWLNFIVEKRFYGDVKSDRGSSPRNLVAAANEVDVDGWASHVAYFSRLFRGVGWGRAVDPFWIKHSSFCSLPVTWGHAIDPFWIRRSPFCLPAIFGPILLDCPGYSPRSWFPHAGCTGVPYTWTEDLLLFLWQALPNCARLEATLVRSWADAPL